tara:strand:- start:806 stop:3370 length:2565 start_codon:yes stop_codon:yes gene_type:complete
MPKRIIFKNASSGQRGVTVQRRVQDTTLLWDRIRIECSFDVEIYTEEVLILLAAALKNGFLPDEQFIGDNKRFIKIDYERDKSMPPSKFDEFKKKNEGVTKAQQYASIRANITQGAFFDNKNSFRAGNTFKSVCTDGAYLGVIRQYLIYISQTIKNITTLDYLDEINIFFKTEEADGVKSMSKLESFHDLYILQPSEEPYQIQPKFFGDNENIVSSNKFWVLPPQFKKYGITYELYHEGNPPRVLTRLSELDTLSFTILNGILRIEGLDIFCSYKLLFGLTPISGLFSRYRHINATNIDEFGELSYNSIITCTRYELDGITPSHQFSFTNNIAEGLTGYYHQLDETKTTTNNLGFFEEDAYKRAEDIANILLALKSQSWFSPILTAKDNLTHAFDFTHPNNELQGGDTLIGSDGVERYTFIDNVDSNGIKSITAQGGGRRIFNDFTFKRISFIDSQFVGCDFSGSTFIECDFTGVNFEDCDITNLKSNRNIWDNFNEDYILNGTNSLKIGHKYIGGRFIGNEIKENDKYFNYTTLRSYDERSEEVRLITTEHDVSMNFTDPLRIDEVTFRSYIEVDPFVNVRIDLSYVNLQDVSTTDISSLEQPVNILVRESAEPGYVQANTLYTRLHLIPPPENPPGHKNMSLYTVANNLTDITVVDFFYRKYSFYYSNASLFDHEVENPLFYNYQFQKELDNPNGIKLFGFNNTNANDHPHVGSWGIGVSPYNTINSNDVILQFAQSMSSTFGYNKVGPLTYYKLDEGYNKYNGTGGIPFLHNNIETNFKIRKGNLNYDYIDTTSSLVANRADETTNPIKFSLEVVTTDPSLNYGNVGELHTKLDDEYIPGREQRQYNPVYL